MGILFNAQQGFLKVLICPWSDHLDEERSQISRSYEKKKISIRDIVILSKECLDLNYICFLK